MITKATGVEPYFVGKPNPRMMRSALNEIDGHSETTAMIGDRMDTDIVSGMEAGLYTILVLTGVTQREQIDRYPFRPSLVVDSVADLIDLVEPAGSCSERIVWQHDAIYLELGRRRSSPARWTGPAGAGWPRAKRPPSTCSWTTRPATG